MTSRKDPYESEDGPKMKSGRAALAKFVPCPTNPRTHPTAEIALLAELIKRRGPDQPIVVDEDWIILKGHGRRAAAVIAGLDEFPYVQRFGLSEADKRAIRIEDNQVALLAGWDTELIRSEIRLLSDSGYNVSLLGFGETQLVEFTTLPSPPTEFKAYGEDIPTDCECPKCGFKWSSGKAPGDKKDRRSKK